MKKQRCSPKQFLLIYQDLPCNDFNALFKKLEGKLSKNPVDGYHCMSARYKTSLLANLLTTTHALYRCSSCNIIIYRRLDMSI